MHIHPELAEKERKVEVVITVGTKHVLVSRSKSKQFELIEQFINVSSVL
jgi:hypothetical protein